jgi:hypothetical protein
MSVGAERQRTSDSSIWRSFSLFGFFAAGFFRAGMEC